MLEHQDPVVAAEVLRGIKHMKAMRLEERRYRLLLVETDFQAYHAVWFKMATSVGSDGTIGIQPILSAIKRGGRIVEFHFRLKVWNDIRPDIRRI